MASERRALLVSKTWLQAVVLMEYGSVFGHGAYLGPDYTADYLRRASDQVKRTTAARALTARPGRTIEDFRA
jgi:nitric oxide reductase subunit B